LAALFGSDLLRGLLWWGCFLNLGLQDRLANLIANGDLSVDGDESRKGDNALKPGNRSNVGLGFAEASIKHGLESHGEELGAEEVGDGGLGSTGDPVTFSEAEGDELDGVLHGGEGFLELVVGHFGRHAENGLEGGEAGLHLLLHPQAPLINLG